MLVTCSSTRFALAGVLHCRIVRQSNVLPRGGIFVCIAVLLCVRYLLARSELVQRDFSKEWGFRNPVLVALFQMQPELLVSELSYGIPICFEPHDLCLAESLDSHSTHV